MSRILHVNQDTSSLKEWEKNLIILHKANNPESNTTLIVADTMGKTKQHLLAQKVKYLEVTQ